MAGRGIVAGSYHNAPFSEAHSSSFDMRRNTARARVSFYISPDPLPPALPLPQSSNNPPPPGRGRSGRRERFAMAGVMIIANEYAFPGPLSRYRSFAIAAFIAWGGDVRRFPQLILSLSHQGKAAAMMACRSCLASRPSVRPATRVLVSPLCSLFICVVASRRRRRFPSPRLSRASPRQISRPLPIASFASLIRLVPRPGLRLAARLVLMSSRLIVPFSSRFCLVGCQDAARLPPVLLPRRFVQLISPFSPCLVVIAAP